MMMMIMISGPKVPENFFTLGDKCLILFKFEFNTFAMSSYEVDSHITNVDQFREFDKVSSIIFLGVKRKAVESSSVDIGKVLVYEDFCRSIMPKAE